MREKIKAGGRVSPYRLRKRLPEPVFGQIKQARGFRQFLLRGVEKVAAEWAVVCIAHNVLKLAQGWTPFIADTAAGSLANLPKTRRAAPAPRSRASNPHCEGIKQTGS